MTPHLHPHHVLYHLMWLWGWFLFGALMYMVKRAFYMITGPNPVAPNVSGFVKVAGVPLLFRLVVDSGIFWILFVPQGVQAGLNYMGWQSAAGVVDLVTRFGVFALFFGLGVDPLMDWVIPTVVGRIPLLKDFWPQLPGPPVKPSLQTGQAGK